jgi:hypothetical protein
MTPLQMSELRKLSNLFSEGKAQPEDIRQLSELLAAINSNVEGLDALNLINDIQLHSKLTSPVY